MRVSSSVTSVSWIPSEAVSGPMKLTFTHGVSHYDTPPPDRLDDLETLRQADGFRFANVLRARAEFDGDTPVAWEQDGGTVMGSTTVRVGHFDATFAAVTMPELRPDPKIGRGAVTFSQTVGGRTALPLPRRVHRPPFVRLQPPLVWTTLQLTLHADGTSTMALAGASPFPRHWVYDHAGAMRLKAGVADWPHWLEQQSWVQTPWGHEDSPVVVAAAESALEHQLSGTLMHGCEHVVRTFRAGEVIARQGEPGDSLFLVLDGMVDVTVDEQSLGDLGPGAVLGERAVLDHCPRTATVTALTPVRVAEAHTDAIDHDILAELATHHHREQVPAG